MHIYAHAFVVLGTRTVVVWDDASKRKREAARTRNYKLAMVGGVCVAFFWIEIVIVHTLLP